ncbi:hypothetical protein K2173_011160 [Erythroxylum novogranatense]|uniref:Uncharacterized protein n=1 Tax=Erythroxylum novogranatense TaxID=1862640 RepID=A0AAV8T8U0_9ROSI|nr:hypothetical protein K2173_011160 [Erythroxylum novogranatense]
MEKLFKSNALRQIVTKQDEEQKMEKTEFERRRIITFDIYEATGFVYGLN